MSNSSTLIGLLIVGALLRVCRRLERCYQAPLLILESQTLFVALRPNPLNKIPGPWHARFTSLRLKLAIISGRRIHHIHDLHQKYGPYVRIAPDEVAVNDPKGFAQIHAIAGGFEKSKWYEDVTQKPRPTLLVMPDAKAHARRRKLLARAFSKSNIKADWEGMIKAKTEAAVGKIQEDAGKKGTVDLLKWWMLMASDVSSHLMFGESFGGLERGEINEYIRVLTTVMKGNGIGAEFPIVRTIGKLLPFQTAKELFRTNDYLEEHSGIAVKNARGTANKNILAPILAESEKAGTGELDDIDVREEASVFFVAGTDTAAITLTYLTWAVLRRPELRKRVEEEVAGLREGYSDADVEKLPLLNAVIEETLRLYGAAPGALPRVVPAGGRDVGGYYLPQGVIVSTHSYSLHRDPELFPDPWEFKPERFLSPLAGSAKIAYTPFGAGARVCLGIHIAYCELRLASAEFFRRCPGSRLAPRTTDDSMEFENFWLIAPKAHRCEAVLG